MYSSTKDIYTLGCKRGNKNQTHLFELLLSLKYSCNILKYLVWKLKKFKFESRKCYNKLLWKYMFKNFFQNISCLNNLVKNRSLYNDALDFSLVIKWPKFTPETEGSVGEGIAQNKEGNGGDDFEIMLRVPFKWYMHTMHVFDLLRSIWLHCISTKEWNSKQAMFHKHNNSPPQRDQKPPPSVPPSQNWGNRKDVGFSYFKLDSTNCWVFASLTKIASAQNARVFRQVHFSHLMFCQVDISWLPTPHC